MDSFDLVEEHEKDILTHAPEIPHEHMEAIDQEHILVHSSNQEQFYSVNTMLNKCDCKDFPHIRLCKHLAAVWHYSGGGKHLAPTTQPCLTVTIRTHFTSFSHMTHYVYVPEPP